MVSLILDETHGIFNILALNIHSARHKPSAQLEMTTAFGSCTSMRDIKGLDRKTYDKF